MTDLLRRCAALVDVPSVSHQEAALADVVEAELRAVPWLTVDRVGDNVVARTVRGRAQRLLLVGHLDTVPPDGNDRARLEGDVLWGLGSADMKGGLAVFLELATTVPDPVVDVSYVFYACEEVARPHNGLSAVAAARPELLAGDAAVLGEPTGALVEAGCQGSMRLEVVLVGSRAHTARPWTGRNAVHRLAPLLARVAAYEGRRPVLDGCEFREALQAVLVEGGVAGNVVPDRVRLHLNHRFAPDRSTEEAFDHVREVLGDAVDPATGDEVRLVDVALPAPPGLDHPLLQALMARVGAPPRAKLGWTDVAFFAERGVPALNFGPGEATVAHTAGERVERAQLEAAYDVLHGVLTGAAD
ncbi:MAG TPA: succinyl-diaminopimelate desuccinylase [Acidimicrobiales bacterium]|nr:succinyl-diaminopimelate desuccinylase [Acidimicrobiales bacterium]